MKRTVTVWLAVLLLLSCVSCNKKDAVPENTPGQPSPAVVLDPTEEPTPSEDPTPSEEPEQKVVVLGEEMQTMSLIASGGMFRNYSVRYPYFANVADEHICKISQKLYEMIPRSIFESTRYQELHLAYKVTLADDQFLSVLFTGYWGPRSYADYERGITIDIETGEPLTLGDFFTFSELQNIIDECLESGEYTITYIADTVIPDGPIDFKWDELSYNKEDLLHCLKRFREKEALSETDNFYIKENKICLIGEPYPSSRDLMLFEFDFGETPAKR